MLANLKSAFDYYVQNQQELVDKYKGRFLVIRNETVVVN